MVRAASPGLSRWSKSKPPRDAWPMARSALMMWARSSRPFGKDGKHKLALGNIEDHPYLKNQERLTFARCGITDPVSVADYVAAWRIRGPEESAWHGGRGHCRRSDRVGPSRPWRCGLPDRHQVENRARRQGRSEIHLLQCRRRRQRHLRRPHGDGGRSLHADRRHDHRRHRRGRHQGLRLHPLGISRRHRHHEGGDCRRHRRQVAWRKYSGYGQILHARSAARGWRLYLRRRNLDARKPRRQARHGAGPSRRSRHSKACSASPRSSTTC